MTNPPASARPPDDPLAGYDAVHPGTSVVVPCFNSGASLRELVSEVIDALAGRGEPFEIVLVNDDSDDPTWEVIRDLCREHGCVRGLNLMRNYGQHNATLCGVRSAERSVTVTLDDDLQHPPEMIPRLLDKLAEGHDVVYGVPLKARHSLFRKAGSWLARHAIALATRQRKVREFSSFRAFRTPLRSAFLQFRGPQPLFDVLLGWGTTRIVSVAVEHRPRPTGRSNYGFFQLCSAVIGLWMGYTTAPLRLASWIGLLFVLFGMGILVYVVGRYLAQGSLPGFPFLASTIAIFGGVQLFALGIIGEYLARLFDRSMDRPAYVIKESVGAERRGD